MSDTKSVAVLDTEYFDPDFKQKSKWKLKKSRFSSFTHEAFTALGALEYGNIEVTRKIALDPAFVASNKEFVNEGKILHVCVKKNFVAFAEELVRFGYSIPNDLLIKAIKRNDTFIINVILSNKLYKKQGIELEYWYLLYNSYYKFAEKLAEFEENLLEYDYVYNNMITDELFKIALIRALERKFDDLSALILSINPSVVTKETIKTALDFDNLEFLRRVWTGHYENTSETIKKRNKLSPVWDALRKINSFEETQRLRELLDISNILKHFLEKNLITEARKVIAWPEAAEDKNIFKICVKLKEEELARDIIKIRKKYLTKNDFAFCFESKCFWLCLDMLKWKESKSYLFSFKVQSIILDLLEKGSTCYFAAEFLSHIDAKLWSHSLTKKLCLAIQQQIGKTDELLNCPFPLLYLVLLSEFLLKIAQHDIFFTGVCNSTANSLLVLAECLESTITEELELKNFVLCVDSQGRSVLKIIEMNKFYSLLSNNDIGSIISTLWIGEWKHNGILNASSLYTSFNASQGSDEKLIFLNEPYTTKNYMFQYNQLVSSCQLRFFGQMVSTVLLVYFYTMIIYTATIANSMEDVAASPASEGFLRISQVWIGGIFVEKISGIIFCVLTKRKVIKDFWLGVDVILFAMMLIIMTGANQQYGGDGKLLYFISAADLNILMHGFQLCLVWLRFFNTLLTSYTYGPLLEVMYLIASEIETFLLFFFSITFLATAVMYCLFNYATSSDKFETFSVSLRTLFRLSLNDYTITDYTRYGNFGPFVEAIFGVLFGVMLTNVLLSYLVITFEREDERKELRFRATMIKLYYKWNWDDQFGILILLPSPLSIFGIVILPLLFLIKKTEKANHLFSKIFFILYALGMFGYFASLTALYIPLAYFSSINAFAKGGVFKLKRKIVLENYSSEDSESDEELSNDLPKYQAFSIKRAVVWVIVGAFIIMMAYIRDLYHFWTLVYKKVSDSANLKNVSIINSDSINFIQEVLNSIDKAEFSLDEFLNRYNMLESAGLSKIKISNVEIMKEREERLKEFFQGWVYSNKTQMIRKNVLKTLLPVQGYYSDRYIKRISELKVNCVGKALKAYKKGSENVKVKHITIPKYVVLGQTFQVSRILRSSKNSLKTFEKLKNNFEEIEDKMKSLENS